MRIVELWVLDKDSAHCMKQREILDAWVRLETDVIDSLILNFCMVRVALGN